MLAVAAAVAARRTVHCECVMPGRTARSARLRPAQSPHPTPWLPLQAARFAAAQFSLRAMISASANAHGRIPRLQTTRPPEAPTPRARGRLQIVHPPHVKPQGRLVAFACQIRHRFPHVLPITLKQESHIAHYHIATNIATGIICLHPHVRHTNPARHHSRMLL